MIRDAELDLLLNDLLEKYGYDFSEYARASLKRRVARLFSLDRFPSFAEFRYRLRSDDAYFRRFVEEVTVNVTEMFRDPAFYRALRSEVLNVLATYPLIRVWHAGCATGEEVYSMAILLKEAGLLHKSLLYATDLNPDALERARKGIYPLAHMKTHSENYVQSGGVQDFSQYYTARYDYASFDRELSSKMIFATHNLVSDRSFNEFQLILCRNVMIYFDRPLQERVLQLFHQSLEPLGFLCLGSKENLRFSAVAQHFTVWNKEKIWRKTGA
ncbi:CheR family methyltransferase [Flaviaesturariibacter aridisoli]|uniref:Protein-glutamate O-methyltransferase CheR n=1 Tax=Flaviaesturariibacter aridisoli TaxID=2545761 RepID=A0A4R4DVE0_9BACT|nr:protein-glutamate O-methyltransferase CheR [Flaviaesturariibacter aridisoli]RYY64704.1 MAG: protein-glutamate O-methyltransferase CheR [Chitinophagaceae bacterium]TCZ67490.1 protein-glutamate O-methyltransferase CheR [Flaviaesturariibacter aridisoli]